MTILVDFFLFLFWGGAVGDHGGSHYKQTGIAALQISFYVFANFPFFSYDLHEKVSLLTLFFSAISIHMQENKPTDLLDLLLKARERWGKVG